MKKILSIFLILFIAVSLFALETSSYIDGNVLVGKEGDLPKGFFIKASGYLPGDSVSVTNPLNGNTVELLNLGSVDKTAGYVALLSKEGAEKLGLPQDAKIQMKLTSRQGSYDSSVSGVGVLSSILTADEEKESEEKAVATVVEEKEDVSLPAEPVEDVVVPSVEPVEDPQLTLVSEPVAVEPVAVEDVVTDEKPSSIEESAENLEKLEEPEELLAVAPTPLVQKKEEDESEVKNESEEVLVEKMDDIPMDSYEEKVYIAEPVASEDTHIAYVPPVSEEEKKVEEDSVVDEEPVDESESPKEEVSYTYVPLEPVKVISNIKAVEEEDTSLGLDMDGEIVSHIEPLEEDEEAEEVIESPVIVTTPDDRYEPVTDISEPIAVIIPAISSPDEDFAGEEIIAKEPEKTEPVADINLNPLPTDSAEEEVVAEEPIIIVPVEGDLAGEEIIPMEPEEVADEVEEILLPAGPADDLQGEDVVALEPVPLVVEKATEEPKVEVEGNPLPDSLEEEVIAVEPSEVPEEKAKDVPIAIVPVAVQEKEVVKEEIIEDEVVKEEPVPAKTEEEAYTPIVIPSEPEKEEAYSPIVLEPTNDKAPPASKSETKKVEKSELVSVPAATGLDSYVVEEKDLAKAKYYVQIALMEDKEAISKLINKYNKYPIVLVPRKNASYSVLVGPLSEDEYGVVLENFKSYGFKDAFIKRIR